MQTLKIARLMRDRGHQSFIFCTENSTLEKEAQIAGIQTVPVFRKSRPVHHLVRLIRFLRKTKPDVIHTHLSHDLWLLVPAIHIAGSKARLFLTKRMASGVKKTDPLHRYLYNRTSKIFAISNYIRTSVLNTCPVSEDDVQLMHNAINPDHYSPEKYDKILIRKELGIAADEMVIGIIGRMSPGKGHEEFFHAASQIKQIYPLPICFMIVGEASFGEDDYGNRIKKLAEQLFQQNELLFTGFRKDIPNMLSAMDILAFPSHEESFGNVLLEAMAMNLPVVACNSGGVGDIVVPNETGLLVPPRDADALATALLKLVLNSQKRSVFGKAGRQRVEQFFTDEKFADSLEASYKF